VSFIVIPQLYGPPLTLLNVCFFELEQGGAFIDLEYGSGFLQLQMCNQPLVVQDFLEEEVGVDNFFELEDGSGDIELED